MKNQILMTEGLPLFDEAQVRLDARFNGSDYDPKRDNARLTGQINRVFTCMKDGRWRTLDDIHFWTDDPQASISAQLRHLRKARFGAHTVEKRHRGEPANGLYEYRLVLNAKSDARSPDQ